jgi:membrane-bound lytic murein transglycosylase D
MPIKISPRFYFIFGFFSAVLIFFLLGYSITNDDTVNAESQNPDFDFPQGYRIVTPHIPEQLEFAGEKIPTENFEVKERIEREFLVNTYWHSSTMLSIKRANRWFPIIEPILKKNNIPDDFKYLAVIESGLVNAISPAGATGFWQFMEATAKQFGLEVNSEIDERYHVEKSTEAACKYLRSVYNKTGSWITAAASYNMGPAGIERQAVRQKTSNYFNLVLNEETSRYISRIIAVKEILQNPQRYGYYLTQEELYHPLSTENILVNHSVNDWADFAISKGINYKILKLYNPWLRDVKLVNKAAKPYSVQIPLKGSIEILN